MAHALSVAVVGHTNTGKTSLLRTLLRDEDFGEVAHAAGTTRHVEAAVIQSGADTVTLYDTPGLEDAGGVLAWLEENTPARADGIDRLNTFLQSPAAAGEFNQEAKVLRSLAAVDMALYVIDAREPVANKYRDELTVLSWCAKPLMPVLNFLGGADTAQWQNMLARRGLHVISGFDTVAFDFSGEINLWQNLATMLPEREIVDGLIARRRADWTALDGTARREIAAFLLNVAALRREIGENDAPEPAIAQMQAAVRQAEAAMQKTLLHNYRFYREEVAGIETLPQFIFSDPFDPELWKAYGIRTGKGAAAGALIGLGVDVATLGTSAGLGTALGGIIGGLLPNMQTISDKISGVQTLIIDTPTIILLATRATDLLAALQSRGHAAQNRIEIRAKKALWREKRLPEVLKKARRQSQWSALNAPGNRPDTAAVRELAQILAQSAAYV